MSRTYRWMLATGLLVVALGFAPATAYGFIQHANNEFLIWSAQPSTGRH